jgi:type I restriction enzyme M protein
MLDSATKHRIDNARDVLVGKVPDPKAQVEQITTALIYKFMDDMDQESVGMGGKASFFTGAYEKYAWPKITATSLGGFERLSLYSEAIERMSQNPNLPQLFRDIFKDAFLPYKDPETLNLFLKEIDGFKYDHSERLGDAFEYLLSVLGSQGAAGQFRTPRHIIDFIVEAVGPGKTDSVLDPACGTAGFLISAYKHILAKQKGKKLPPDEMAQLTRNFVGYDIAPEMVRLSLVNMYLHKFPNPTVFEYDTLTSEERWDDTYDVILANPPFMTPKGGIRPHARFSVSANRSEVLFVDYIAEHLNPEGRAGVIVPEGIIFQSSNAYKALRKMLIEENYLYAVVSLPAGVFNPYSGVKTSILLLDKKLARQTGKILFVNIENDGFNLGAQRGKIAGSDFPEALQLIQDFQIDPTMEIMNPELALAVEKSKIAEDGEYNFSATRYKEFSPINNRIWPNAELNEICEFSNGLWKSEKEPLIKVKIIRNTNFGKNGALDLQNVAEHEVEVRKFENREISFGDIILENSGGGPTQPVGRVVYFNLITNELFSFSNFTSRIRVVDKRVNSTYLFFVLRDFYNRGGTEDLQRRTSGIRNLDKNAYKKINIPLPPLDVQREIVEEIEGYQKVIDGARQVVEHYKPRIQVDPEWPLVELGEVCNEVLSGGTPSTKVKKYWDGEIPWISSADIFDLHHANHRRKITEEAIEKSATNLIPKGNVIVATRVSLGKLFCNSFDVCISQDLQGLIVNQGIILPDFLVFALLKEVENFENNSRGATIQGVTKKQLVSLLIPLPDLETQKIIIEKINSEQKIIDANKELIEMFEKKIAETIGRVWGEE